MPAAARLASRGGVALTVCQRHRGSCPAVAHGKRAVLSRLAGGGRARVAPSEDLEAMIVVQAQVIAAQVSLGCVPGCQPARRSSSQPATAVRLVAAAPSRLVGTPATLGIGCGGSSTPVPGTSGATQNGAQ